MQYDELLKKAYEKMPKLESTGERFEVPVAEVLHQGNQTLIKNFSVIASKLRREPQHILKFLTKELASPGNFDGQRALFQTYLQQKAVQNKIEAYVKEYVICKECKRPDTRLERDERIEFMKCEACGARSPMKAVK